MSGLSHNGEHNVFSADIEDLCQLIIYLSQLLVFAQRYFPGEFLWVRGSFDGRERHCAVKSRQRWLSPRGRSPNH